MSNIRTIKKINWIPVLSIVMGFITGQVLGEDESINEPVSGLMGLPSAVAPDAEYILTLSSEDIKKRMLDSVKNKSPGLDSVGVKGMSNSNRFDCPRILPTPLLR